MWRCFTAPLIYLVVTVIVVVCSSCVLMSVCLFIFRVNCFEMCYFCDCGDCFLFESYYVVAGLCCPFWLCHVLSSKSVCNPSGCLCVPSIC